MVIFCLFCVIINSGPAHAQGSITVLGKGVEISNNDLIPDLIDGTNFGEVDINAGPVTETFVLRNDGIGALSFPVSAVAIVGSSAFTVNSQPPLSLLIGEMAEIEVEFDPATIGTKNATLVIVSGDLFNTPFIIGLTGEGVNPEIRLIGDNALDISDGDGIPDVNDGTDFEFVEVGDTDTQIFTIENTGTTSLTISGAAVTGAQAGDFSITGPPPASLAPGATAPIMVEFAPSATGARDATITISSNDADEAEFDFAVTGQGAIQPTVQIQNAPANANAAFSVDFIFSEDVTGFTVGDIIVSNGVASNLSGTGASYSATITPTATGLVTIDVPAAVAQAASALGNLAALQVSVDFDADLPSLVINGVPAVTNTVFTASFEFNEDITGFEVSDIILVNATAGNFTTINASTYTALITPQNDGNASINVPAGAAQDLGANDNIAAPQVNFIFDTTAPDLIISIPPVAGNSPFTATFTFNEDVTGFTVGDISLSNATAGNFSGSGAVYTALITPDGNGDITLNVAAAAAQDIAGNDNNAAQQATTSLDTTAPSVVISSPASIGLSGFTATFTFSEDVTGFIIGDIGLTNATASNFSGSGSVYTASITPDGNGDVALDVAAAVAQDLAGNDNIAAQQVISEFDNEAPNVVISGAPALANGAFTVTFEFSEAITDFTLDDISVINGSASDLQVAANGPQGQSVYTVTITPEDEGNLTLTVDADRYEDLAGNRNIEAASVTLGVDLSPPSVTISATPQNVDGPFQLSFTFSEEVANFELADITLTNAVASGFSATSAAVYTALITPQIPGQVTVEVLADAANDLAGNGNLASERMTTTFNNTDLARNKTLRIINNFLVRRSDQLTLDSPDLARRILDTNAYGRLSGSAVADNVQLAFQGGASGEDLNLDHLIGEDTASKFNLWTQVSISAVNAETAEDDLIFVYLGADYKLAEDALVGAIVQYDFAHEEDDIENFDISGHGWLFGPYIISRLHENLIFDGRVAWGQSYNKIRPFNTYEDKFKTGRWLINTQFTGDFLLQGWRVNPDIEFIFFEETQKAYTDELGNFIPPQTINLGRATFGPRVSRAYLIDNRLTVSPSLNFEGIWDFDQTDIVDLTTGLPNADDALRARFEAGVSFGLKNGVTVNLEGFYDGIGVSQFEAHGLHINFNLPF